MQNKVIREQYVSKDCFVCGTVNQASIRAKFYEMENGDLVGVFTGRDEHQSYPNRMHGGVIGSILDEAMGRSLMILEPGCWSVTVEMNLKYLKPVPLNEQLIVVAKPVSNTKRVYDAEAQILLNDGVVAATAQGKYVKMNVKKIDSQINDVSDFMYYENEDVPEYIEY